jgi:hypothetical protein
MGKRNNWLNLIFFLISLFRLEIVLEDADTWNHIKISTPVFIKKSCGVICLHTTLLIIGLHKQQVMLRNHLWYKQNWVQNVQLAAKSLGLWGKGNNWLNFIVLLISLFLLEIVLEDAYTFLMPQGYVKLNISILSLNSLQVNLWKLMSL